MSLQELKAIDTKIEDARQRIEAAQADAVWKNLKKKAKRLELSPDDEVDLQSFEQAEANLKARLCDLKNDKKYWEDLIVTQTKGDSAPESKPFGEADAEWTKSVTGINTDHRLWMPVLNENIVPSDTFKAQFEDTTKFVHMNNEAGRRFILNLFLLDIVKRPEFNGALKIYPETQMEVKQSIGDGTKRRKLSGIVDYTVGLNSKGLDMFDIAPPKELHLIAIEAKVDWGTQDFWKCVAETATLYKSRKDAGKSKCNVWGVLSNATDWQFIFIDDDGNMSRSKKLSLDPHVYDEDDILKVYRFLFFAVESCFDACAPNLVVPPPPPRRRFQGFRAAYELAKQQQQHAHPPPPPSKDSDAAALDDNAKAAR